MREIWLENTIQSFRPIWMEFLNLQFNVTIPPGESQLEFDSYQDLVQNPFLDDNIVNTVRDKNEIIGRHDYFWLWVACALTGVILISVGIWKCSTMPCCKQLKVNPPIWKVRFHTVPLQGSSEEASPRVSVAYDDDVPNEET